MAELDRYEEAAAMYERAANWDENDTTTPLNLYSAAEAYTEAGMNDEAARVVNKIIENYPDSQIYSKAERMKGMLAAATNTN